MEWNGSGTRPTAVLVCEGLSRVEKASPFDGRSLLSPCVGVLCFCRQCKPGLWRELAKEVAGNSPLLEGFLEAASKLALISDHRAQEFVFEALYRLWKVTDARPCLP